MPKKVAVVGSGLAGLTAAYILSTHQDGEYEVHIYEKHTAIGMDAASISLPLDDGPTKNQEDFRVDVPIRGFFPGYYQTLMELYKHLGLEFTRADHTISFSIMKDQAQKEGSIEENENVQGKKEMIESEEEDIEEEDMEDEDEDEECEKNSLFRTLLSHKSWNIFNKLFIPIPRIANTDPNIISIVVSDWLRLLFAAKYHILTSTLHAMDNQTLESYFLAHKYDPVFIYSFMGPVLAATCTCAQQTILQMPANIILDFLGRGFMTEHGLKLSLGVAEACRRLTEPVPVINLGRGVNSCWTDNSGFVWVQDDTGRLEKFDRVIFATQANHAYKILSTSPPDIASRIALPPNQRLLDTLSRFSYESTSVVTHSDSRFMPRSRKNWAGINIVSPSSASTQPMATCYLNVMHPRLRSLTRPILQTVNPFFDPSTTAPILQPETTFGRVVLTPSSHELIDELDRLQGTMGLYFVGSYVYPGVPLLEGCAISAIRATADIMADPYYEHEVFNWLTKSSTINHKDFMYRFQWQRGTLVESFFGKKERNSWVTTLKSVMEKESLINVFVYGWRWFVWLLVWIVVGIVTIFTTMRNLMKTIKEVVQMVRI